MLYLNLDSLQDDIIRFISAKNLRHYVLDTNTNVPGYNH